jgi:hypothetical protein
MSGIRAVTRSAEVNLPAEPHAVPTPDECDDPLSRRPRKRRPADEITEGEAHQLDVEA